MKQLTAWNGQEIATWEWIYKPPANYPISRAIRAMIDLSRARHRTITLLYNEVSLQIHPEDMADEVYQRWVELSERQKGEIPCSD